MTSTSALRKIPSVMVSKNVFYVSIQRLEAELASHEPAIQAVQEAGEKLMDVSNLGVPEIEQRLKLLNQAWSELKQLAASRGQKLDESLTYQQFLAKVEEEEAWIRCVTSHK